MSVTQTTNNYIHFSAVDEKLTAVIKHKSTVDKVLKVGMIVMVALTAAFVVFGVLAMTGAMVTLTPLWATLCVSTCVAYCMWFGINYSNRVNSYCELTKHVVKALETDPEFARLATTQGCPPDPRTLGWLLRDFEAHNRVRRSLELAPSA
ncbi:MAG: hypothetical protein RL235_942 [Chlamydiota bacterium]|jgi:hypothetical protein